MPRNIFLFLLLLLFSCTNKVENEAVTSATQNAAPVQVTTLANLPDSLQPETILLKNTPALKTVQVTDKRISFSLQEKSGQRSVSVGPIKKIKASLSPVLTRYTTEQGLAIDVMAMGMSDKKGNLWFGTSVNGVSKYDGHSFTNYSTAHGLVDNKITRIIEDREGNIWFATEGGASKFDGHTFTTVGDFKYVTEIKEDRAGNIWIADMTGLYKYANHSITKYSESDGLTTTRASLIEEDDRGNLWVGTDNGLFTYDGKRFTPFGSNKETVLDLCIDNKGSIWASVPSGYLKYDNRQPFGKGTTPIAYPFPENSYSRTIYKDLLGRLWLGNWIYDNNSPDSLKKFYDFEGGRPTAEDQSGNLWFNTAANGVIKYSGPAFQQLTSTHLRNIFEDNNGDLWIAKEGITRFDGDYFTNYGLSADIWSAFQDRTGIIWLGSGFGDGMMKFENNAYTFYTELNGLVDNSVRFMIQDSAGYIWIGTENGLSKFDGKSFTNFTKKQGLPGDLVSCIVEDKQGKLLLGTAGGLSIFDGKSFTNYSISQTLPGNDIRAIIIDKNGNLWMGTYGGGICRYDGKSFYTYTTEQGLPDNVVTQVALTKEGHIIVGTNNGIAVLTGFKFDSEDEVNNSNKQSINKKYLAQNNLNNNELKNYAPVFEIYNPKTGYPVMDVNRGQHAIFEDSKGILWIASGSEKSGLMRFDYSSLYKNNKPPELNILSIKINNELVCWHDLLNTEKNDPEPKSKFENIAVPASVTEEVTTFGKPLSDAEREEMRIKYKGIEFDAVNKFYPVPQNLKVPHSHNDITFEFAAIEPDKPSLVQYQYKLEGYDKNWSTPANITSATFGNIYEGTYELLIRAKSPSGIWSNPVTYTFTVLPPWWRTWWAYTMYALLFLFTLRVFVKWRERNLQMEKVKLENTVVLRTAEVVAEKKKSDDLLLNILPEEVAEELKAKGSAAAKQFDEVTVMFTDFKDFTHISEKLTPSELVAEIHTCFKAFDVIVSNYGIEKIKTIGDSYMCAGGLPIANKTNAVDVVSAAMEIQQFMQEHLQQRKAEGREPFEIRIGIHTGPVVAGIVGVKKFAYDIWGDTVNIASRMETSGEAGKVNISGSTYKLVQEKFICIYRGKIQAKNKGEIDMYFVQAKAQHV